jgi:hypothetical protein
VVLQKENIAWTVLLIIVWKSNSAFNFGNRHAALSQYSIFSVAQWTASPQELSPSTVLFAWRMHTNGDIITIQ